MVCAQEGDCLKISDALNISPWNAPRVRRGPRLSAKDSARTLEEREYLARVRANKALAAKERRKANYLASKQAVAAHNQAARDALTAKFDAHFEMIQEAQDAARREREERWREQIAAARNERISYAYKTEQRMRQQVMATPGWAERSAMLAVYVEARRISAETGIKHHVDHIVPLQSKLVCGLHCNTNMRIIPSRENLKKKNVWWPDMP